MTATLPTKYDDLLDMHPPRLLRTEEDYEAMQKLVDSLSPRPDLTEDQEDYLEMLSVLMGRYEDEHHVIDTRGISALDVLKALLDENKMNASDLSKLLGDDTRSLGSKILKGQRDLSKAHILILSKHFRVDAGLFLAEGLH